MFRVSRAAAIMHELRASASARPIPLLYMSTIKRDVPIPVGRSEAPGTGSVDPSQVWTIPYHAVQRCVLLANV